MLQAPRLRPCEGGNVAAAAAAACTAAAIAGVAGVTFAAPPPPGAIIFGVAAINAGAGVAAVVDTADFGHPGWGRWFQGIAFRYSLGSGTRFFPWRLTRRTGPTPVMLRSDSLSKSVILPPF